VTVLATQAKRVPEEMFIIAARAVLAQVTEANLASGLIYRPAGSILDASLHTAGRIAEYILDHGLASVPRPDPSVGTKDHQLSQRIVGLLR
jgi:malate dehydrogenase (oxaloacetate-decarboxylating)(NADP+)